MKKMSISAILRTNLVCNIGHYVEIIVFTIKISKR